MLDYVQCLFLQHFSLLLPLQLLGFNVPQLSVGCRPAAVWVSAPAAV